MKTASGGFCCVHYLSIVEKILKKTVKTTKILQQIQVNYTRVFNITFIGFLIIQLKFTTNNLNISN